MIGCSRNILDLSPEGLKAHAKTEHSKHTWAQNRANVYVYITI